MLTGLSGKVITYDGENRPVTVTFAGQTTTYAYAPDGTRIKMVAPQGTYVFVSPKLDYYYANWGAIMVGSDPHPALGGQPPAVVYWLRKETSKPDQQE